MNRKEGKNARRTLWTNKEILAMLRHRMEAYRGWKQGTVSGKNTETLRIQDQAKAQIELNLPRDFKNKEGFYKYMGDKHETKEST